MNVMLSYWQTACSSVRCQKLSIWGFQNLFMSRTPRSCPN